MQLKTRLKSYGVVLTIGLCVGAFGAAGVWWGRNLLVRSMISASDDWMLNDRGPRWGVRTVSPEIVFVEYGEASAVRLSTKPTPRTDSQLYRALLDAGASAIMDARALAAGTPEAFEEEVRPYLDVMAQSDANGRLARDIAVTPAVSAETLAPYLPFIQHNSVNLRSPKAPLLHSRIYPLLQYDFFSLKETAALWLARRHRDAPAATAEEVAAQLRVSGLQGEWERQAPGIADILSPPPGAAPPSRDDAAVSDQTYDHPQHAIHWLPFETAYPTVAPGGFWIDYSVDTRQYPRLEYGDVAEGDFDASTVAGKIVLIGLALDFVPSGERFAIPQRLEQASESEVLAAAVQTLLDGRSYHESPLWAIVATLVVGSVLAAFAANYRTIPGALILVALLFAAYLCASIWAHRHCLFPDIVWTPSVFLCSAIAAGVYRFLREVNSRRRITDMFGRYVPRAVVEQIIRQPELQEMMFNGVKRVVTVLFADIRGFTRYSESRPPEDVLLELNRLLKIMVDCTFQQQGTVDKFIGDAVLVLFNAPTDQEQHAEQALRTAWEIQSQLADAPKELGVGIGIHTGQAVVGHVGTPQRMEYTAIGNTVNLASRLCDEAAAGEIIVTQAVADACRDEFLFETLPPLLAKGLSHEVQVARVAGLRSAEAEA